MLKRCCWVLLVTLAVLSPHAYNVTSIAAAGLAPLSPRIYIYPLPDSYRDYAPAAYVSMYRYQHDSCMGWHLQCQHDSGIAGPEVRVIQTISEHRPGTRGGSPSIWLTTCMLSRPHAAWRSAFPRCSRTARSTSQVWGHPYILSCMDPPPYRQGGPAGSVACLSRCFALLE